jgi:hypothetical protein
VQFNKIQRDLDIFNADVFRLGPNHSLLRLERSGPKIRLAFSTSLHSDGAIGDKFFTYHSLEFFVPHHPLEPLSLPCLGNVMLGVTFEIVSNDIHQHAPKIAFFFGCVVVVKVRPFLTWLELHNWIFMTPSQSQLP